ncbi:phage tail tape measure protein [Bacillus glycinifermentans]|uniref:phage tail tape measure protein n=1 Tax=Bacillus glycinifermentans TaxID=1664069 RepID=UPI002DBA477A|nr:phage tail tape measure protein [Bacillus glycinifermentans]MEC3606312.1 phage tail tape measure protein [Bacillus glycinifermentans]
MSENRRIGIHFDVNGEELQKLERAVKIMDNFNKHVATLQKSAGSVSTAFDRMTRAQEKTSQKQQNLSSMLKSFDSALKSHHFTINNVQMAQNALSKRLEQFGRNVKVTMDETGRFTATLTNMRNQTVKMSGGFDVASGKLTNLKRSVTTTNDAVDQMRRKTKEAVREMEKMRGIDISNRLPQDRAWNVQKDALIQYGRVIQGSIDRNNKFTQTVVTQQGEVKKITGYYNQAKRALVQYNEQTSKASRTQLNQAGFTNDAVQRIGLMSDSMKGLNKYTMSWNEAMAISATRMIQWGAAGTAIFGTKRALTEMMHTIIKLDEQFTAINRVIDLSAKDMDRLFQGAIRNANTLGIRLTEINESMIEFGRQGFGADDIETLVKATGLLKNVADMDMTQASENMTAYLATFRKEVADIGSYVDRLNEVDNKYAVSVDQLSESVRRAGGTANAFGVSIDNLLGYTTAVAEATRESGSIIGNSFKTIFSRITTIKEAEDALDAVGVSIRDVGGDMKSVDQILAELHGKWDGLSDAERQHIAVTLAGRYQLNRFLVLMQNFDKAMMASKTATQSWGSAQRENQRYMGSLRANIEKLWTSLQLLAHAVGEAGLTKAFGALLAMTTTMVTGFTKVVQTLDGFTFALPVVTAGIVALTYNFMKLKGSTAALQAGLVTVNPTLTALGTRMGMSTATATIFAGAVGKVTMGLRTLAMATVANPLFWIPVAISGLIGLIGHFENVKRRQEDLNKSTKDAKKEYQDFLDAINNGTVDAYQIEKYKEQMTILKDQQKELNKYAKEHSYEMQIQTSYYSTMGVNAANLALSKEELVSKYKEETSAMKALSDEEENLIAQMGIKITKDMTISELSKKMSERHKELSSSVKQAEKAMEEQRLKGVLPSADAYFELGEAIDDQASSMENAIGLTDKIMNQMKEQKALIELLSGVKNKDAVQTQLLDNAYDYWSSTLGVSEEKLKKHPELMNKQIKKSKELLDITKKLADGTASAEEKRRAQQLLTAQNKEKATKREAKADQESKEIQRKVYAAKLKKLHDYDKAMSESSKNTKNKLSDSTKTVKEKMKEQRSSVESTKKKYQNMSESVSKSSKKLKDNVTKNAKEQAKNHKKHSKDETDSVTKGWNNMWDGVSKIWGWIKDLFGGGSSKKSKSKDKGNRYAKGTSASGHPGGPAIVGEEGRELAYIPGVGTTIVGQNGPEFLDLPKGTSVLPNKHTEHLLKRYGFPGYANGIGDYFDTILKGPKALWDLAVSKFNTSDGLIPKWFTKRSGSPMKAIGALAVKGVKNLIDSAFGGFLGGGYQGGAGADVARKAISTALSILGKSQAFLPALMRIAFHESGYNPRAVNNWDINARRGDPSVGLFQIINSTFQRYKYPGMNDRTNPLHSAVAAIRYLDGRYGGIQNHPGLRSMARGGGYKPYAEGGFIDKPHMGLVGEAGPEAIIPLSTGKRSRALELYAKVGNILGVKPFANGGIVNYKVKRGDTISELAMKYFGNAYSGGMQKLLKMNPQIKNPNRIYVGQTIKVPSSKGSSSKSKKSKSKKPMFKNAEEAQNYLSNRLEWIDQVEALGIRASDYRVRHITSEKYRKAYEMTGRKNEYNKAVFDELSKFTDANYAKKIFNQSKLFLSSADKAKTFQSILKNIGQNVLKEVQEKTTTWLEKFNSGVKEASASVKEMINISEQVKSRKLEEKKDNFVNKYTSDLLAKLGVAEEVDPAEALKNQAEELKRKIEERAEESALLEYRLSSSQLQPRLKELAGYKSKLEAQMKAIEKDFKNRGITDKNLISEAQQPLKERLAEITEEYNELQNAISNGNKTLAENKAELERLAQEYKDLQKQIEKTESKREFTDVWGNIVRDAEGNVKMITDQGQLLMNTYEKIKQEMEAVQQIAVSGGGFSAIVTPIIEQLSKVVESYKPTINTEVDPGKAVVTNNNSAVSETRTYEANTNVNRNVSYHIHTGVALASETELREFAMMIKEMIDEEEGRSRS